MPRRDVPHPEAMPIARRIKALREERGMTMEALAIASNLSKGHVSSIESGRTLANVKTLNAIARGLELPTFFLFVFPELNGLHRLADLSRRLTKGTMRKTSEEWSTLKAPQAPAQPKAPRNRVTSTRKV